MSALAVLAGLGALAAGGAGGAAGAPAGRATAVVTIRGIDFHPRLVTVRPGGRVTWRFADPGISHNVTSRGAARFHSSQTRLRGAYTVTFPRAGAYRYVCTLHPNMAGRVVVR